MMQLVVVFGEHFDVEREGLQFFEQHLERLGDAGLGDVVALDDALVRLDTADDIVRLDGEDLLQDVRRAVGFERPDLHFAEALAAELRLAAERLLRDEGVRADGTGMDLVVDEVDELDHVHAADRGAVFKRFARAAVVQLDLAVHLAVRG